MDPLNYEPRGDRVIVRRVAPPAPQEGDVLLPASQQKPLNEGIVVAVGPGLRNHATGLREPLDFKVGDHICFLEYAGFGVEIDGVEYLSMRDEEIHGRRLSPA